MKSNLICKNECRGVLHPAGHSELCSFFQQIYCRISLLMPGTELGTGDSAKNLIERSPRQLASGKMKRKWLGLLKRGRQARIGSCTGEWGPTQLGQGHELTADDISLRSPYNYHQIKLTLSVYVCKRIRVYFSDNAFSLFVWFCRSPFTFLCPLISLCDIQGCPGTFYYKTYRHFFFRLCTHSGKSISGFVSHGSFSTKVRWF